MQLDRNTSHPLRVLLVGEDGHHQPGADLVVLLRVLDDLVEGIMRLLLRQPLDGADQLVVALVQPLQRSYYMKNIPKYEYNLKSTCQISGNKTPHE